METKKIVLWILVLAFLYSIFVAGCGEKTETEKNSNSTTTEEKPVQKIVIKLSHCTAPESPKGKASEKFAELIKEKAGDRIEVQIFPSSQLYGDKEEMQALMANNAQIIVPSITKLVAMDPSFQVVDLPFLFPNDEAVYKFWDGEGGKYLLNKLEKQGIIGLAAWNNAPINIIGKKIYKSPADLKGVKVRIPAGQVTTDVFSALGAGASTIPFAEVYTSLQQGVVDSAISSVNNFDTEKYYEVVKYLTIFDLQRIEYIALTNTKFWNSVPEDLKLIIQEAMNEAAQYERKIASDLNKESLEKMKQAGVEVYECTSEDKKAFEELFKAIYDKWLPVIGEDLVNLAREAGK
ncbi:MAG: DctP family TRAP transporter solute-binding subunit [Dehalobacterium sp.]